MATTTQIIAPARVTSPLALWHLLSLDAPTVAALWTYFIARANHVQLSYAVPAAMFLAVWLIYAADRLLDTRHLATGRPRTLPATVPVLTFPVKVEGDRILIELEDR